MTRRWTRIEPHDARTHDGSPFNADVWIDLDTAQIKMVVAGVDPNDLQPIVRSCVSRTVKVRDD